MHRATLKTGEEVVIKVQRKGIYETMARDIGLMHKAVRLMPPVSIKGMVDLNMVLSELWTVTQEEMNFLTEAANMAEFAKKNKDVAFVKVPILYREYISPHILVMDILTVLLSMTRLRFWPMVMILMRSERNMWIISSNR